MRNERDAMSKAFTKETDDEDDEPEVADALPATLTNYMTPGGFAMLQAELRQLMHK